MMARNLKASQKREEKTLEISMVILGSMLFWRLKACNVIFPDVRRFYNSSLRRCNGLNLSSAKARNVKF